MRQSLNKTTRNQGPNEKIRKKKKGIREEGDGVATDPTQEEGLGG